MPVTKGAKDHGSDGGLQWRADRLVDMQAWTIKNFGVWDTIESQAAFTLYETKRDYQALDAELRAGAKSIATMATNFNRVFERSADNEELNNRRIKYAGDTLAAVEGLPSPDKPIIAAGGIAATSGVVHAVLWNSLSPLQWSALANLVMAAIAVFLGWRLYRDNNIHRNVIVSAQSTEPPFQVAVPVVVTLTTMKEKIAGDRTVLASDIALAEKMAAAAQAEVDEIKGMLK